ncbi:MAG: hypothetical protein R2754_05100 [Microthrixaceae bacterium]
MPWCDECDKFYTQSTLNGDGTCPEGHQAVDPPPNQPGDADDDERGAPWHFWLMVAVLVLYLAWRLIQGVVWAIGKL